MKIKRDYNRIIDEIKSINPNILLHILRRIYSDLEFQKEFNELQSSQSANIVNAIIQKYKNVKYKELLHKIIIKNNKILSLIINDNKTKEEITENILNNSNRNSAQKKMTTYSLLLYYLSKNIFHGELIDFLKDKSKEFIEDDIKRAEEVRKREAKFKKIKFAGPLKDSTEEFLMQGFFCESQNLVNTERIPPKEIEENFECVYDEEKKEFNKVKRGILYFLQFNFKEYLEVKEENQNYHNMLMLEYKELGEVKDKYEKDRQLFRKIQEKINDIKQKNRIIKQQNKKLKDKILKRIDKSSNKDLENQNYNLKKDNYYLQTRLEKLEEQVAVFEEEKRLNTELSDNITIEEKPVTKQVYKPEYMNIVVAGGRWTSDNRKKVQQYLPDNEIEFIEADKILRNYDKIANCDIIFFDTSYNSHAYYYKLKKCSGDFYHINASNLLEFEKIYEGE